MTAVRKRPARRDLFLAWLAGEFGFRSQSGLVEHLCQPFIAEWVAANRTRFRPVRQGARRGYEITVAAAAPRRRALELPGKLRGHVTFGLFANAAALRSAEHRHLLKCAIAMRIYQHGFMG
jgi:hypothetical protein